MKHQLKILTSMIFVVFATNLHASGLDLIIPKLYLPTRNTPSGNTNWTITNAATNNTSNDYWKLLINSAMISPAINFGAYTDIEVSMSLQSYGTISNHSDDIALSIFKNNEYSQIATNLHTSSTSGVQKILIPNNSNLISKLKLTAPNSSSTSGARIMSVEIKGKPISTPLISTNIEGALTLDSQLGDSTTFNLLIGGVNLSKKIGISLEGNEDKCIHLSTDSISSLSCNSINEVKITYKPTSTNNKTVKLIITSDNAPSIEQTISTKTLISASQHVVFDRIEIKNSNGSIYYKAKENEIATLYDLNGRLLKTYESKEGWNEISWFQSGIYLIRIGKKVQKIML
jgi:hypothetical protein